MKQTNNVLEQVRMLLPEEWNIQKEGQESCAFNILDSYEGTLLLSDLMLIEYPGDPAKMELIPGNIVHEIEPTFTRKTFSPNEITCDSIRNAVTDKLGSWRIGLQTQGTEFIERFRIENQDQKGVARLYLRSFRCKEHPEVCSADLIPYRGYESEVELIHNRIGLLFSPKSIPRCMHRSLPEPALELSKPIPKVVPTLGAREAVANLVRHILNRVRYFEPGVLKDHDPEVLHQYRVSIRRIRSLVQLLKEVFTPDEQELLKTELKSAMQETNRLRDLDVQIADMPSVLARLPDTLQPGMNTLEKRLRAERARAFQSVRKSIQAATFDKRFARVTAILDRHPENDSGIIAGALDVAIVRRHRRIVKETRALDKHTQSAQLHSLRVSCKKLRYLIDFFPQILNQGLVAPLIKNLKKLQNLLGRYNDLCVLERFLLEQARRHHEDSAALMAIGAVIMQTHLERIGMVKRCVAAAQDFCSTENKQAIKNAVQREKE